MKKPFGILAAMALTGCAASNHPPVAASPPVATVPLPPSPPRGEPALFTGIDASRLRALVGAPVFTRKDGDTEMWRYDAASCHAFFFLTGAPAKVQHVETLPHSANSAADPDCLTALRKPSS
jgi:hypothetical protein